MSRNTLIAIGAAVVVLGIGGVVYGQHQTDTKKAADAAMMRQKATEAAAMKKTEAADAMKKTDASGDVMQKTPTPAPASPGAYVPYSGAKLAATHGPAVIFFAASWCETCQGLSRDIETHLGQIPAGTTILKADYDSSIDLRRKYGVTIQHTLVQVDSSGTKLKQWHGSPSLASLVAQTI